MSKETPWWSEKKNANLSDQDTKLHCLSFPLLLKVMCLREGLQSSSPAKFTLIGVYLPLLPVFLCPSDMGQGPPSFLLLAPL